MAPILSNPFNKVYRPARAPARKLPPDGTPLPWWTPERLVVLQLSKLLNYYQDDLDPAWGGNSIPEIEKAVIDNAFVENFVEKYTVPGAVRPWLAKIYPQLAWGPDNCTTSHEAWRGFGKPYEPYLSMGGNLYVMSYVAQVLAIDELELTALKLWRLLDQLVIAEAVKGMLRPPPSWPQLSKARRRPAACHLFQAQ